LIRSYVWGSDLSSSMQGAGGVGGLLEVAYHGAATTNAFVGYDGNGNVSALVNSADGTSLANYEYGPFGENIRLTGPLAKNNPFRFSTKYQDDESDLVYYGRRYYKPSTGTWTSRDPINEKGGVNLYCFLKNSTVARVDPFGLSCMCGRDVDGQVATVLNQVNRKFSSWDSTQQDTACHHLIDGDLGASVSWDIRELNNIGQSSATGCARRVTFQGKCYFASAVNYALFGRAMCNCHKAFPWNPYYTQTAMVVGIIIHKETLPKGAGFFNNDEAMQAVVFALYGYTNDSSELQPFSSCLPDWSADPRVFAWRWAPIKTYEN
jgi:RHS repeat-associated protein